MRTRIKGELAVSERRRNEAETPLFGVCEVQYRSMARECLLLINFSFILSFRFNA